MASFRQPEGAKESKSFFIQAANVRSVLLSVGPAGCLRMSKHHNIRTSVNEASYGGLILTELSKVYMSWISQSSKHNISKSQSAEQISNTAVTQI